MFIPQTHQHRTQDRSIGRPAGSVFSKISQKSYFGIFFTKTSYKIVFWKYFRPKMLMDPCENSRWRKSYKGTIALVENLIFIAAHRSAHIQRNISLFRKYIWRIGWRISFFWYQDDYCSHHALDDGPWLLVGAYPLGQLQLRVGFSLSGA